MSALDVQVGGSHYKDQGIQPVEYAHANGLDFFQGNVVKYVTRWRNKGGIADLEKAKHYLEMYIELETKRAAPKPGEVREYFPMPNDPRGEKLSAAKFDALTKAGYRVTTDSAGYSLWRPLR